jgi:hypothetical protein
MDLKSPFARPLALIRHVKLDEDRRPWCYRFVRVLDDPYLPDGRDGEESPDPHAAPTNSPFSSARSPLLLLTWSDRGLIGDLARPIPRERWRFGLATPKTIFRWHRAVTSTALDLSPPEARPPP